MPLQEVALILCRCTNGAQNTMCFLYTTRHCINCIALSFIFGVYVDIFKYLNVMPGGLDYFDKGLGQQTVFTICTRATSCGQINQAEAWTRTRLSRTNLAAGRFGLVFHPQVRTRRIVSFMTMMIFIFLFAF